MFHGHKRCVRHNEPGHAHALTFSCYHQAPYLADERACLLLAEALDAARARHRLDLWACVIMPEHVHLVLRPREAQYSIATILQAIKRPMAFRARKTGIIAAPPFWQPGGGYDRNLRTSKATREEIEYIHLNPARRGLCGRAEEWRFSSAAFWTGVEDAPLKMDRTIPPYR